MENFIKGMTTCKVCGRDFPLLAEEHYVSKEPASIGLSALAGHEPYLWDSFDCPHCGCQNTIRRRNRLTDIFGRDLPFEEDNEEEACCGSDACPLNKGEQE